MGKLSPALEEVLPHERKSCNVAVRIDEDLYNRMKAPHYP